jgi:hydroxyethylthiazole kinase-like uncharacterized protein yjeF
MDGVWSTTDVRAAERAAMAGRAPGALMACAARALAVEAAALIGFSYGASVALLVGSGDNGGDALFAGAELSRRGARVTAVLAEPQRAHSAGLAALRAAGGRVVDSADSAASDTAITNTDLLIDGLVGIGFSGALRGRPAILAELAAQAHAPVLAVDIPSGVDPATGQTQGPAIRAHTTLCMGALKAGLFVGHGRQHAGQVIVVDIGLGPHLPSASVYRLTEPDVTALLRRPGAGDTKYSRGVVGVVAGSAQYPGAAQLAVGSARLGGAGAVRYAGHAAEAVLGRWPEVLATATAQEAGRVQCWVIGPGLGDTGQAVDQLEFVLGQPVPVLVDADGLNLLAGRLELLSTRRAPTILTPHDGEFERLFGPIGGDRIGAARRAGADSGAVVLLKGDATIVAEPAGRCFVNPTGVPELATAGSGDVLSGLIGSVVAAGAQTTTDAPAVSLAAAVGAYLHGQAGARAALDGPVCALDLISGLRGVIAEHRSGLAV